MGADSQSTRDHGLILESPPKIFRQGEFLFGCCGSPRLRQLLRYTFVAPEPHEGQDDEAYICSDFINSARELLREQGFITHHDGNEYGGQFLVGYRGQLYEVGNDYAVDQAVSGIAAIGCGSYYALGAMYALDHYDIESAIRRALAIAAKLDPYVSEPFVIEHLLNTER